MSGNKERPIRASFYVAVNINKCYCQIVMEEKNNAKKRKKTNITFVICALISILFIVTLLFYFRTHIAVSEVLSKETDNNYYKEYALITRDTSDDFWTPVYEKMAYYGDKDGIYVQWMGKNITTHYSWQELMEIAIEADVEGIIVEADDSEECCYWINKAEEEGIPVITVRTDSQISNRISYVGVSYYNLGTEYGNLVLSAAMDTLQSRKNADDAGEIDEMLDVMVLMNKDISDNTQNTILLAIQEQLNKNEELSSKIKVNPIMIDNSNDFSAEESIQDLLKIPDSTDIIICLGETNTVSLYQAVVEQNKVGEIVIIGYSDSDTTLKAIQKNIIYASITADVDQLGKSCIEALGEYSEYGRVSDYYSVNFTVIDSGNVRQFLKEGESHEAK